MLRKFLYLSHHSAQSDLSINRPLLPLHPCLAKTSLTFSGQISTTLYRRSYAVFPVAIQSEELTRFLGSALSIPCSQISATPFHTNPDPPCKIQFPFGRHGCSFTALCSTGTPSRGALPASLHPSCLLDPDKPPAIRSRRIKSATRCQQPVLPR